MKIEHVKIRVVEPSTTRQQVSTCAGAFEFVIEAFSLPTRFSRRRRGFAANPYEWVQEVIQQSAIQAGIATSCLHFAAIANERSADTERLLKVTLDRETGVLREGATREVPATFEPEQD